MKDNEGCTIVALVVFLCLMLGILIGAILTSTVWPKVEIAEPSLFLEPESVWLVTVDDVVFTCMFKPVVTTATVKLRHCKETYGGIVKIESYQTISIRERE